MAKLFFIGDSITAGAWDRQGGWANRLIARIMQENIDRPDFYCVPYNLGVSGYTFSDTLKVFEREVKCRLNVDNNHEKIQLVVSLGVNDSWYWVKEGKYQFSDQEFQDNIEQFVKTAQSITDDISFVGLLPVDESLLNPPSWAPDIFYKNGQIENFENIIKKVSNQEKKKFLPMFKRWKALPHYKELLDDGVHPNSEGHALMAKEIETFLLTEEFYKLHKDNGV